MGVSLFWSSKGWSRMNGFSGWLTPDQPGHGNQIWKCLPWSSLDHSTTDLPKEGYEIPAESAVCPRCEFYTQATRFSVHVESRNNRTGGSFNYEKKINKSKKLKSRERTNKGIIMIIICARNLNLTMPTNGICTTQHLS